MLNAVVYLPHQDHHAKKFRLQPKIRVEFTKKKPANELLEMEKLQEKVDSVWKTLQDLQTKMIKKSRIVDLRLNRL